MPYEVANRIWPQRNIPWSERDSWRSRYPGAAARGMMGGMAPQQQTPSWEMLQQILGGIQGGQKDYQGWLQKLLTTMGSGARSQLAGGIGSQLSRTNVAVPVGADALANKYMSGLDDQFGMLKQLINQPSPYSQNLSQAMSIGQGLAPMMGGGNTSRMLEQLKRLLGGGR